MSKFLSVLVGAVVLAGAGYAVAQTPTPPPAPPGPAAAAEVERGPAERGEHGWRGMMHGMHRPPMSKAARFMFRRGDAVVAVKCADDEPMKACVDAASVLLDKLAAAPK